MSTTPLDHLATLEAEAITIIREVTAESERPVLLFSGGKDSAVLVHLAVKAFLPGRLPFPLLHVDTGHNFPEVITFRDSLVEQLDCRLVIASVEDAIANGLVRDATGPTASRNRLQSAVLLDALRKHRFDAAFGGGRRDEDKARAKERLVSIRDAFGQWDPRNQRPEPWGMLNLRVDDGEHVRAFPISNWTELDVWRYIEREEIELPSIYFSHRREVFSRSGMLLSTGGPVEPRIDDPNEAPFVEMVRYRTVGDMSCTGAIRSEATSVRDVIAEVAEASISERGATRNDDAFSETSMEDRKREGYF